MVLGFTLVELIVVIVILVILATIGFLNFKDYPKQARDTTRISDFANIRKAMGIYYLQHGNYPDSSESGTLVKDMTGWLEKDFNEEISSKIGVSKIVDPQTKKNYKYLVSKDKSGYILKTKKETGGELKLGDGAKNCNEIRQAREMTIKDFVDGGEYVIFGKDGNFKTISCFEKPKSCKEVGSLEDGTYDIYLNGTDKIQVYCDMTTDGGGWTRYLDIKGNYTFEDAKNCWLGDIINNDKLECFNPNRFNLTANDIMIEQSGINYFYKNNSPEASFDVETKTISRKCLGGKSYMTIMSTVSNNINNWNNVSRIRLGISLCMGGVQNYEIGGLNRTTTYMNYSARNYGPKPGDRESTAKASQIFIR